MQALHGNAMAMPPQLQEQPLHESHAPHLREPRPKKGSCMSTEKHNITFTKKR